MHSVSFTLKRKLQNSTLAKVLLLDLDPHKQGKRVKRWDTFMEGMVVIIRKIQVNKGEFEYCSNREAGIKQSTLWFT